MERNGFQLNESIQLIDPTSISEQEREKKEKNSIFINRNK